MSASTKTALASALGNIVNQVKPDGGVNARAPKDKASPAQLAQDELSAICDEPQLIAVASFWENAKAQHADAIAKSTLYDKLVADIHPTGVVAYGVYSAIITYLDTRGGTALLETSTRQYNAGKYAATCYRNAVRRLPGMGCKRDAAGKIEVLGNLPMKNDKRNKGGTKGNNADKWFKGVHRGLQTMMDRVAKAPKSLIDADVFVAWMSAYKAMVVADKAMAKRIANDVTAGKAVAKKAKAKAK